MKVKDGAISRKQAVKALIGWDEEAKDEDIIFTLNELPNVVPKKDTEPTIPLSVIEKIKAEIDNDRLCYAEELQKPLKKKHTLYELKEYTARQELLSMKCAICQDVLDIIDKAVKEIEHE